MLKVYKPHKKVSDNTPSGTKCPSCGSYNLRCIEERENNGIIGPGFASWVIDNYYSCTDCGTRFDLVKTDQMEVLDYILENILNGVVDDDPNATYELQYVDYEDDRWTAPVLLTKERIIRFARDFSLKKVRVTYSTGVVMNLRAK